MNGKYRVYDKQEKRYVTDEWMWVIRPDGTLAYVDYDDVIGYLDAVAEHSAGLTDKNGREIFEGDILLNSFAGDKWVVVWDDAKYDAWLIPNSGIIGHPNDEYPEYTEDLYIVCNSFEIIGSIHDTPKRGPDDD